MFLLMVLFLIYVWRAGIWRRGAKVKLVTTHYSTLPFGWFAPRLRRYCFLQDEEWLFVPDGMTRRILRSFILFCCASSRVVTSNEYISARISSAGIHPEAEARIWASSLFESKEVSRDRSIDIAMLLRHGSIKRLDLYLQLLHSAGKKGRQFAVITCEDDIAETASKSAAVCLLRPSDEEMKTLYERSKLFVLLSDREGFGLPPLEAMGSGCVPVCRDSGGIRCYMKGPLKENVIPLDSPVEIVWERLDSLLADPRHLSDLSDMARTIFAEGARAAVEARSVALTLLSS
jgi:glycosyltransferase involved in cell wall biosynthesis